MFALLVRSGTGFSRSLTLVKADSSRECLVLSTTKFLP